MPDGRCRPERNRHLAGNRPDVAVVAVQGNRGSLARPARVDDCLGDAWGLEVAVVPCRRLHALAGGGKLARVAEVHCRSRWEIASTPTAAGHGVEEVPFEQWEGSHG